MWGSGMRGKKSRGSRTGRWPVQRLAIAVPIILLAGCASQPAAPSGYDVPGFFGGLWHGLIAPIAFLGAIVTDIRIYASPNSGNWYDFGFLLGLSAWAGGAASAQS